jgi:HD-GYP domain-containing protein (c-di-GMP phosphodiesterase class II)
MDDQLTAAQALRYARELRHLHGEELVQRRRAEEAISLLRESYRTTVSALAAALELRDDATGRHAARVTEVATRLAQEVAPLLTTDPDLEYGFLLHDLGKIGIPDSILKKPGPLDEEEMEQMRYHPVLGVQILDAVPYLGKVTRDVVGSHHERWDGTGYPDGLAGREIPPAARIFAVADAYDAMTNDRAYRAAMPVEEALAEISRCAGTHFDPDIAAAFVELQGARVAA